MSEGPLDQVGNFVHTIDRLCRRPPRGEGVQDSPQLVDPDSAGARWPHLRTFRAVRRENRDLRGIPLVHVREAATWPRILAGQEKAVEMLSEGIPRAHPDIPPGAGVAKVLSLVVAQLQNDRRRGGYAFRRFHLVQHLLSGLPEVQDKPEPARLAKVRDLLHQADDGWTRGVTKAGEAGNEPMMAGLVGAMLRLVPGFLHHVRRSGRVPWLSGKYRWLRQALEDGAKGSLPQLVTGLDLAGELPDELLADAFIADLRAEHRRSFPFHTAGHRRIFYPLVLLGARGADLARLLLARRNADGRFQPLVLVLCDEAPDEVESFSGDLPGGALWAVIRWRRALVTVEDPLTIVRAPVTITAPAVPDGLSTIDETRNTRWVGPPRRVPWWATVTAVVLFWVGLAMAVGAYAGQTAYWHRSSCATGPWTPWAESGRQLVGTECVGVAEPGYLFTPSTNEVASIQRIIHEQNQRAEEGHDANMAAADDDDAVARRPYVTLVYLAALTTKGGDSLAAVREGLAGVAIAQARQNAAQGASDPIVRILVANAGGTMQHGERIAGLLSRYDDEEGPIVGVIGLDQSRESTVKTILALGRAGVPIVASTLSADRLVDESPFYFQVAPQNKRQAAVATAYAGDLAARGKVEKKARVYYSHDVTDYYSDNLRKDVADQLRADAGFSVERIRFTPDGSPQPGAADRSEDAYAGDPRAAGRHACGFKGLVYFAGRGLPDFQSFMQGIDERCADAPPTILGGDDVTRYVADVEIREKIGRVPFAYQSFAVAPKECGQPQQHDFYTQLFKSFAFECQEKKDRSLDGHAALSYDAAETMIAAIRRLGEVHHRVPVNSFTVWRQLTVLHASGKEGEPALQGATGGIEFGRGTPRQYPRDKPVLILQVTGGARPTQVGGCGSMPEPSPWCASIKEKYR